MFTPPILALIGVGIFVAVVVFWFAKGRQMWDDHKLRVRAQGYVKTSRSEFVPHGIEEIWMTLPLMQKVLHERAVFIKSLMDDKLVLEKKRADNPFRADYIVQEHVRLEMAISKAQDEFRFAVTNANQFARDIGIVLPTDYKDHVTAPTEILTALREEQVG